MTIKKRLFCSNILMIVVPAAIVAVIGLLCVALLWITLQSGGNMWLEDGEDLTHIGQNITDQIQGFMDDASDSWTSQMGNLEPMTRSGAVRIVIVQNGGLVYVAGEEQPADRQLAQAADSTDESKIFISVSIEPITIAPNNFTAIAFSFSFLLRFAQKVINKLLRRPS